MRGIELEYNGHLISEFNGKLGGFDIDSIPEVNGLGTYESLTSMSAGSPIKYNHGGKYTETLEKNISVCFPKGIDCVSYGEFANIFFNNRDYCKLRYPDNDNKKDYYYMAKLINPKIKMTVGNDVIYQVSFDVDYETPYAIGGDATHDFFGEGTYAIQCDSHYDSEIYPNIDIVGNGNVILENKTNGSKFIILLGHVVEPAGYSTEEITIDNKLQIKSSDTSKPYKLSDVDLVNGKFFYLSQGYNELSITGKVTSVQIKYPIYKKVGA